MKDISLYGHLTIDTILDGAKEKRPWVLWQMSGRHC